MNRVLREGLLRFLEAMPEGATNGSVNWTDEDFTYGVSATVTAGNWQLWANVYPTVLPTVATGPIPVTFGNSVDIPF